MNKIKIESTEQNKRKQKSSVFHSSSAVFLVVKNTTNNTITRISLLNHFLLKRNIKEVTATVTLRDLTGNTIDIFEILLNEPKTYTFDPCKNIEEDFTGAVYINFQSEENLAVPFCAVISEITCKKSICAVHTYGRVLEQVELNGPLDFNKTIESGWTLRDNDKSSSFAALHNGQEAIDVDIELEVMNYEGRTESGKFSKNIKPYGTLIISPKDYIKNLNLFLNNKEGHALVRINGIRGIFPRLICGNMISESHDLVDATELQFTHSNFDFSEIDQPESKGNIGFFNQPYLPNGSAITYPIQTKNQIFINNTILEKNKIFHFNVENASQVTVQSKEGNLPSRLVSASIGKWGHELLDSECSTGIFVRDYITNTSHWHWGYLLNTANDGEGVLTIHPNYFDSNISKIPIKISLYDTCGLLFEENINIIKSTVLNFKELLEHNNVIREPKGSIWYVVSGNHVEALNIFSTYIPNIERSGFTEHAF